MKKEQLGVLFTCYNEKEAVKFSIDQFRIYYPNSKIYLVSEGNLLLDNSDDNIKIVHDEDTMGFYQQKGNNLSATFRSAENQTKIKKAVQYFLNRLTSAIEFCNAEYMILMDPDALVRGKLNIPEDCKLLGSLYNTGTPQQIKDILSEVPGAKVIDSWGATPGIFHVETFNVAYDKFLSIPNLLDDLTYAWMHMFSHDIIIPIIFALIGVEETKNLDLTECNTDPDWEDSGKPLIHHFKRYYPNAEEYAWCK